jgi:hypothetical protein
VRRLAIVAILLVAGCGGDDGAPEPSAATSDVDRCLEAATVLGDLAPATNLRDLQDAVALVAATARSAGVEDDNLAAALEQLVDAATTVDRDAGEGEQAAVERDGRDLADAYAAIDAAAQGMETAECRKESWGSAITDIPG